MRLPSISKSKQDDLEERKMSSDSMRIEVIRGITGPGKEEPSSKKLSEEDLRLKDDGSGGPYNEQDHVEDDRLEASGEPGEFESREVDKSAEEFV
jgi:hypothetical protein